MTIVKHRQISMSAHVPLNTLAHRDYMMNNAIQQTGLNIPSIDLGQNDILGCLPRREIDLLLPHLELCHLPFDKKLYDYGDKLSHVYFPTTAIVSLLYVLADGGMTEISVVGHEGILGISALMGESALGTAMVQCAGDAYKLKTSILKDVCAKGGRLQQLLMRYTQVLFAQIAQNSVCSRHYSIDQQMSRWLLERLDRLPGNELKVTHEMIANMLGVRRETVTEAAGKLQNLNLIHCKRGNVTVIDRDGLELYAGECYRVAKHELDQMLSQA